ncbi:MAG: ATP-grasp domain-containing protein [Myxococcaceae bacterium]
MRLTILSRSARIASTARLVEAARARGHAVQVLDPVQVEMHLDRDRAVLYYRRRRLPPTDAVIPRIAESISTYGMAVVNQFALQGVPLLNGTQGISGARNKMRCLQLLASNGVNIPATVMARSAGDLRAMVKLVGGVPVLVKLLRGQERRGVMVCESLASLEAALEAILGLGQDLILQQYVRRGGLDVRVLVVGGEAVAAVRRRPRINRLAHTLNRGARLEPLALTEAQRNAAVKTARLVGLEVAGVDLIDVRGQPKVFEVNASPALAEMERATGLDLAGKVVARVEALVAESTPGARRTQARVRPLPRAQVR